MQGPKPLYNNCEGFDFLWWKFIEKKNFPELLPKCVDFNSLPAEDSKGFF